ncbi:MAG: DUF87 domain-containing protein [Thermoplasmata archaeon]|nr:DUF87 domain-containing protein [Thermoplasmata archaeon]
MSRPAEPVEGPSTVRRASSVDAPLLVERFPQEVPFGVLGRLIPTSTTVEIRLQLHPVPHGRALELLQEADAVAASELVGGGGHGSAAPAQLESEAASAHELGRRVAEREQQLFRVGLTFHCRAPSPRRAERHRADLVRRAQALGFRLRRPLYEAGLATAPPTLDGAEPRPAGYWHTLHTDGVAAFFPFLDEAVAEPNGILVGLLLDDAAPVFLSRFDHASHSWGIFGTTGAGKTFLAALTALRTHWMHPALDLVVLDPLGEFGGFVRALGGSVVSLARDGSARLNPLDPTTTGGDREEKAARVGAILRALFPSLLDEEAARLDSALERIYQGGGTPTFLDLIAEVERGGAGTRLSVLLEVFRSGSLRSLDGPSTVDWGSGPTCVDLSGAADSQLAFHLAYVLDAVYGRVRRAAVPTLLLIDEAHLLARDPVTAAFLDRLVRHIRHFEGGVLLLSQNPDDFLQNESGRSLLRNLRATVLLRLPEVSRACREFFDLTDAEAEWIPRARLPREAGYSEGLLRHGPAHLPLACVASTPEFEFLTSVLTGPGASAGSRTYPSNGTFI